MQFPEKITVIDVSARDGLQSFKRWVSTEDKVKMIDILTETGFPVIEVAGFAHPRVIPNLRDAEEVCERIKRKPGTVYRGLAPNARGATRAVAAGVNEVVGLAIASDTYLKKNQNMSAEQANDQAIEAFRIAETAGCSYVIAIGMSFWCPYEGLIAKQRVIDMVKKFRNAGIQKMYLAGSVGMEDPRHVNALFSMLRDGDSKYPCRTRWRRYVFRRCYLWHWWWNRHARIARLSGKLPSRRFSAYARASSHKNWLERRARDSSLKRDCYLT